MLNDAMILQVRKQKEAEGDCHVCILIIVDRYCLCRSVFQVPKQSRDSRTPHTANFSHTHTTLHNHSHTCTLLSIHAPCTNLHTVQLILSVCLLIIVQCTQSVLAIQYCSIALCDIFESVVFWSGGKKKDNRWVRFLLMVADGFDRNGVQERAHLTANV